jgi:hypothetical protein
LRQFLAEQGIKRRVVVRVPRRQKAVDDCGLHAVRGQSHRTAHVDPRPNLQDALADQGQAECAELYQTVAADLGRVVYVSADLAGAGVALAVIEGSPESALGGRVRRRCSQGEKEYS